MATRRALRSQAQADTDYVEQFVVVGRLLEKCRSPGLQGLFLVVLRIAGAQHNHGNTGEGVAVLQPVKDNEAIADRQAEVENNQRRPFFLGCGDGGITVGLAVVTS